MKTYYYLIHIQYLGFRFHGWQKQPDLKTVHFMVDKTLHFALGHDNFKSLGSSRTDSKVSANCSAFELFLEEPVEIEAFLDIFNSNLPNDIRAIKMEEVDEKFNIIQTPKLKTYLYLFTFNKKPHPFSASMMTYFKGDLDLDLMIKGAQLFEGEHNFVKYCTKPSPNTNFNRTVTNCKIEVNTTYTANFFPEVSYALRIESEGFMRYQVRLIMGQLIRLGRREINLKEIKESLKGEDRKALDQIAPGSGLILQNLDFDI
jgi:tRNA pseudouridine38-40 synthase